jgi:hypothetical protein
MTSRISYIIATRNDHFCGDPMERLRLALHRIAAVDPEAEVVVVDWGSETPVFDVMGRDVAPSGRMRFLHVPTTVTRQFPTLFSEVHALNLGIRRSTGRFVGRLDQDTLIGERFVQWHQKQLKDDDPRAWFSLRRDLPPNVHWPDPNALVWQNRNIRGADFFTGAVGILLAPRALWEQVRGYYEQLIHRNHMEHDLCLRFKRDAGLENLTPIIDCDFYHLWHPTVQGLPQNTPWSLEALEQMLTHGQQINGPDWGMEQFKGAIVEKVL